MDPLVKTWMFYNWLADIEEKNEASREHGILIGSFFNPEAAKKMIENAKPQYAMTDDEFDKQMEDLFKEDSSSKKLKKRAKKKLARVLNG